MIVHLPAPAPLTWSAARSDDGPPIAELRAEVLRASLQRLGRYDDVRVRERFLSSFVPEHTHVLHASDRVMGSIAPHPAQDSTWIEHFYLHHELQGHGLGTTVLKAITEAADAAATTLHLNVLQQSDARRLYERHGFTLDHEDPVDVYLQRPPHA